jgi:hypothetical protein
VAFVKSKATHHALCYIETYEDDEDGKPIKMIVAFRDNSQLSYETRESDNPPEHWIEQISQVPDGYYRLGYTTDTETEYEEGYTHFSYQVLCELVSLTPTPLRGRWESFLHMRLIPTVDKLACIFQSNWCVDFYYGAVGMGQESMSFPRGIWHRWFKRWDVGGKKTKGPWGNPSGRRLYLRWGTPFYWIWWKRYQERKRKPQALLGGGLK